MSRKNVRIFAFIGGSDFNSFPPRAPDVCRFVDFRIVEAKARLLSLPRRRGAAFDSGLPFSSILPRSDDRSAGLRPRTQSLSLLPLLICGLRPPDAAP